MKTLFERIGGVPSIEKLVTAFYKRVFADPLLSPFFEKTSIKRLKAMQIAFFTIALGGPEPKKMPSLVEAHRNRGIESKHLTRFTELLIETLEDVGIPKEEAQKVYERIGTYSNDILGDTSVGG